MIKNEKSFELFQKNFVFEEQKTKQRDLADALNTFLSSISDVCLLWTSKVALAGEKPTMLAKDHGNFSKYAYMKMASDFKVGVLVIDIDRRIADSIEVMIYSTPNAPVPNLIIKNPANGHVQLIYCLKNWLCIDVKNSKGNYSKKAHVFYKALKQHLNTIFGGDDCYHNYVAKNPFCTQRWDVVGMRSSSYEMYELARISQFQVTNTTFIERLQKKTTAQTTAEDANLLTVLTGKRNNFLFNTVRKSAYGLYKKNAQAWTDAQFERVIHDFACELNASKCHPPLSKAEVSTICRSIIKFCYEKLGKYEKFTQSELSKLASKCGKKGGKAKGKKYAQQRTEARKLAKRGKKAADIAKLTGLSLSAVYNAIKPEKQHKTSSKINTNKLDENC